MDGYAASVEDMRASCLQIASFETARSEASSTVGARDRPECLKDFEFAWTTFDGTCGTPFSHDGRAYRLGFELPADQLPKAMETSVDQILS
ncbi:MAG: hypothetical protein AAFU55_12725, partial [Pseudomonadota bacterium]